MKALVCKVSFLVAVAALLAVPALADDSAVFKIGQSVRVGDVELPAGVYVFRATDRGVVYVYDDERQAKVVATALTQRHSLKLDEAEMSGTLSLDWTVRTLALGDWHYAFTPGKAPVSMAALPGVTTVVAMAR